LGKVFVRTGWFRHWLLEQLPAIPVFLVRGFHARHVFASFHLFSVTERFR